MGRYLLIDVLELFYGFKPMKNRFEGDKKTDIISNTHTFYSNIGEK